MSLSMGRVWIIAKREYLATVRRKGFVFTIVGTPLLYALLMFIVAKPQATEQVDAVRRFKVLGVVDSSGAFASAPRQTQTDVTVENPFGVSNKPAARQVFTTEVRFYDGFPAAERDLRAGAVHQVVVIPADYMESGRLRRYATRSNLFSSMDGRVVSRWLVRSLISGVTDSIHVERAARPLGQADLYALGRNGQFELKDDRREMLEFLFPLAFGLLLGLCIMIGGQYLLQGVTEEKESRILESMLSTVSADELLTGKLIGLGGAGLTVAAAWLLMASSFAGPVAVFLQANLRVSMLLTMFTYFLFGYLFFGSIMTGIGSVASTMREAQQFSIWLVFGSFIPFYLMPILVGHPDAPLAVALSLFPITAPVSMMLRVAAPGSVVPAWQIATSLGLLGVSAVLVMMASSRIFRTGMLMYGKTPNLPEIIRWIRRG